MKILSTGAIASKSEGPAGQSKKGQRAEQSSVPGGDPEILRAMLDSIHAYQDERLPLQALISELEFYLQSLIMTEHDWQQTFFQRWRDLDRFSAAQLAQGDKIITDDARARIDDTLEELRLLIIGLLTSGETR